MLYAGAADPNQPGCNIGSASYALDIPNGGVAVVSGNTMIQGTRRRTPHVRLWRGRLQLTNSLAFTNNKMQNASERDRHKDPNGVAVIGNGIPSPLQSQHR